jgi:hypothetical protein
MTFAFIHTNSSLGLNFTASGLQPLSDESWGLDNVVVSLSSLASNASPTILDQPSDQIISATAEAVFRVTATGAPPLSYQWKRNGSPVTGMCLSRNTVATVPSFGFFNPAVQALESVATLSWTKMATSWSWVHSTEPLPLVRPP